MTDRPILFSAPMVRAMLAGRKTQTRRIIKPQPTDEAASSGQFEREINRLIRPAPIQFAVGDRLWVREAWWTNACYDHLKPADLPATAPIFYQTDAKPFCAGRYRHGRFMCRWMSRITDLVTDVRVQQLQDISVGDAAAEGVETWMSHSAGRAWRNYQDPDDPFENSFGAGAVASFGTLWKSINGAESWTANPWITATTFDVHLCNIDALPAAALEKAHG